MTIARSTGVVLALVASIAQGCGGSTSGDASGGAAGSGTGGGPGGGGGPPQGGGGTTPQGGGGTTPQGGGGWSACFAGGTPIATPSGDIPIDRLRVGDLVLAYDEANHRVVSRPVVRTFAHTDQRPGRLVLADGRVLNVTDNHPIYRPDRSDYADAGRIDEDTRLLLLRGDSTASGIAAGFQADPSVPAQTVYNIEVAEEHNYFAASVLVHNKSGGAPPCENQKKIVDGTPACALVSECLDPDPASFPPLGGSDAGAEDAGASDGGVDYGPETQRYLCTEPDPTLSYPVAFELESTSPYEDYLSLVSSPAFAAGAGGSGPCSGVELGQIWTFYDGGTGTNGWQTLCTEVYGADLNEHLSVRAEAPTAKIKNLRFVQGCVCKLSQKKWNSCTLSYSGSAGASSCE